MAQPRLWVIRHPAVPGLAAVRGEGVATDIVRHAHAKTVVGLCLSGGRRIEAGGGRWCVAPGQGFVIPGGVAHACAPWGASEHAYVALAAAPQCFPACPGVSDVPEVLGAPAVWPSVWEDGKAAALLLRAVAALAAGQVAARVRFAALCKRLRLRPAPLPPLDPAVRAAMAVVDAAPDAPVTLADLAEAAGVSPFRLERLFTRDLGVPPGEYVLSRRVAGAAARIEAGAGLADAALASGFCDQSHLTRHFRRRMGVPPGKYMVEGE